MCPWRTFEEKLASETKQVSFVFSHILSENVKEGVSVYRSNSVCMVDKNLSRPIQSEGVFRADLHYVSGDAQARGQMHVFDDAFDMSECNLFEDNDVQNDSVLGSLNDSVNDVECVHDFVGDSDMSDESLT